MGGEDVELARLLQELSANALGATVTQARGYRAEAPTSVEVAPLAEVLERADRPPDPDGRVTVEPAPSDAWFDAWYGVSGRGADRGLARRVLQSIGPAAGYALLLRDGLPVATGRAVTERLYLQVESRNRAAMARYRRAGFRHAYTYQYRVGLPTRGGETP